MGKHLCSVSSSLLLERPPILAQGWATIDYDALRAAGQWLAVPLMLSFTMVLGVLWMTHAPVTGRALSHGIQVFRTVPHNPLKVPRNLNLCE